MLSGVDSSDVIKLAQEVRKISNYFLRPRNIAYFQFKRTYTNNHSIILANHPDFFEEFLEGGFIEPTVHLPIEADYNLFCFWDETLPETKLLSLKEKLNIFHGLTILTKSKTYYDCTTFAMSKPHPNPVAYYFYIQKELQIFSQIFPGRARHLIKLSEKDPIQIHKPKNRRNPKHFFLPKRSARYYLGEDIDTYITTYEAICMKLLLEGKSYKEIGGILSMSSTTVKTHLIRLKARTGLSFQEISLQSFQSPNNNIHRSFTA